MACLVQRRRHHVGLFAQLLVSGVGKIPCRYNVPAMVNTTMTATAIMNKVRKTR